MSLLPAFTLGSVLGAAYIGHLWRGVQAFVRTGRRTFHWGTFLRLAGVGGALLLIGQTGGPNLIAALCGLLVTRTVLIWRIGMVSRA